MLPTTPRPQGDAIQRLPPSFTSNSKTRPILAGKAQATRAISAWRLQGGSLQCSEEQPSATSHALPLGMVQPNPVPNGPAEREERARRDQAVFRPLPEGYPKA